MVGYFVAQAADTKIIVTAYDNLRGRSFLSEDHQRRVDGDAREPSSDVGSALEVPYVNKCSQQCVLHCVFGNPEGFSLCDEPDEKVALYIVQKAWRSSLRST